MIPTAKVGAQTYDNLSRIAQATVRGFLHLIVHNQLIIHYRSVH